MSTDVGIFLWANEHGTSCDTFKDVKDPPKSWRIIHFTWLLDVWLSFIHNQMKLTSKLFCSDECMWLFLLCQDLALLKMLMSAGWMVGWIVRLPKNIRLIYAMCCYWDATEVHGMSFKYLSTSLLQRTCKLRDWSLWTNWITNEPWGKKDQWLHLLIGIFSFMFFFSF